jgi:hypothetical protein
MATAQKLTMYSIDPNDPDDKTKIAVFELDGDEVKASYHGPNPDTVKREMEQGFYDAGERRYIRLDDGEAFMAHLPEAYPRASFVLIEAG